MIVKCASCETRFKIGDDKVTEKGVKVRCTKCGTIFVVRKGDAAQPDGSASGLQFPVPQGGLPPRPEATGARGSTSSAATPLDDLLGVARPAQGYALSPAASVRPASKPPRPPPDPREFSSAAGLAGTFVGSLPPPDPASPTLPSDDPFASFGLQATPSVPPPSPGSGRRLPGEFALDHPPPPPPPPPPPGATSDEDLLGLGAAWPAVSPPPPPASVTDPFEAALDPLGGSAPAPPRAPADNFTLGPDPFADFAAGGSSTAGGAPTPSPSAAPPNMYGAEFDAGFDPLAGLSLDPSSVSSPMATDPAEELFATPGGPSLSVDGNLAEAGSFASAPPASTPVRPPENDGRRGPSTASPAPEAAPRRRARGTVSDEAVVDRPLGVRLLNVVSGASVIFLLVAAFVAYRNGGRLDLRDPLAEFFKAFGVARPIAASESLPARVSASGFYPTLRGEPLLFARGTLQNLSGKPAQVGLKLEVSAGGKVVATADGLPGVLPSPEDLFYANGAVGLKAALAKLAPPAAPIPVGGSAEFLLVTDLPAGLRDEVAQLELSVSTHPLAGTATATPRPANPAGSSGGPQPPEPSAASLGAAGARSGDRPSAARAIQAAPLVAAPSKP